MNALLNQRDGLFEDADTGEDYSREDNWAARAELLWNAREGTEVRLRYTRDEIDQDARPAIGAVPIPAAPERPVTPPADETLLSPLTAPLRNDAIGNSERRELDEVTLLLTHEFARGATLHAISSYREFATNNREDEDGTNRRDLYFDTNNVEENESWYAELRLSGATEALTWLVGASYNNEDAVQRSETFATTDSIDTALGNVFGANFYSDVDMLLAAGGVPLRLLGSGWSEIMYNEGEYTAFAVFADVEWRINEQWAATVGARYTKDEKDFSWFNDRRVAPELDATIEALVGLTALTEMQAAMLQGFDVVFDWSDPDVAGLVCDNGVSVAEGVTCVQTDDWDDISPRFVLNYTPTNDLLLFASYTQGYKAGGFNSVEVGSRFANEDVENIELGAKWSSADGAWRVASSVFHYEYKDRQAIRLDTPEGSQVPQYLVQTSDETADGLDLQVDWTPARETRVHLGLQYIDLTFDRRVTSDGLDLAGQPTGEPKWHAAFSVNQRVELSSRSALAFQLSHAYRSRSRCSDEGAQNYGCTFIAGDRTGGSRHRTDVRANWHSADERITLGVFVNNAFDNQYIEGLNTLTLDSFGTLFGSITTPRIWGVDVNLRY